MGCTSQFTETLVGVKQIRSGKYCMSQLVYTFGDLGHNRKNLKVDAQRKAIRDAVTWAVLWRLVIEPRFTSMWRLSKLVLDLV